MGETSPPAALVPVDNSLTRALQREHKRPGEADRGRPEWSGTNADLCGISWDRYNFMGYNYMCVRFQWEKNV